MMLSIFFFFNDTATTEIYTLSLHDALPIFDLMKALKDIREIEGGISFQIGSTKVSTNLKTEDRKSTRLNSSHSQISYAVFCLKKKTKNTKQHSKLHEHTAQPHHHLVVWIVC